MTKSEVITVLEESSLDLSRVWLVCGAAMVMHDIREKTGDIDLGCPASYFQEIADAGFEPILWPDGGRSIRYSSSIEIFEEWRVNAWCVIEGIRVSSVEDIIEDKKRLGREKDQLDLKLIQKWMETKDD